MLCLDLCKLASHQIKSLVPGGFAKLATFANEGSRQPIRAINVVPAKFPFYACGDAIRWPLQSFNLQNVAIFRPNIETASDAAICADSLGAADALLSHARFGFGELQNRSVARIWFDALHYIDHAAQRGLR